MKYYGVYILIFVSVLPGCADNNTASKSKTLNYQQADLMIDFLGDLSKNLKPEEKIDLIMNAEGTDLIIHQLNLMRRVEPHQYKSLLVAVMEGKEPQIEPVDSTERSLRGVNGLMNGVLPAIKWGAENVDIVRDRYSQIKEYDLKTRAMELALSYLPENVKIEPKLFLVMGGRAGAAALSEDRIYYDILKMTYARIFRGEEEVDKEGVLRFFAHEMHHIGFMKYVDSKYGVREYDFIQQRIMSLLQGIVAEGSASYLISGSRNLEKTKANLRMADRSSEQDNRFKLVEDLIEKTVSREITTVDEFEKANTLMMGQNYHEIGSLMLSTIDRAKGLDAVMNVIANPEQLLSVYNVSVSLLGKNNKEGNYHIYDDSVISAVTELFL